MDLKLLLQLDVPEPSDVVVLESGIAVGVTMEKPGLSRRILSKDIVTTQSDGAVVQYRLPARHRVGRSAFHLLAILAGDDFFAALRITGYRRLFHGRSENQTVRGLAID